MTRARTSVAAAASALVLAAGCGGEEEAVRSPAGETPAGEWVATTCTAIVDWNLEIAEEVDIFERSAGTAGSPADLREQWADFLARVVGRTDELGAAVDAAGTPPVPEGAAAARDFRAALATLREFLTAHRERAAGLPVEDGDAFGAALVRQRESLQAGVAEVEETFAELGRKYASGEIGRAWQLEEACAGLR